MPDRPTLDIVEAPAELEPVMPRSYEFRTRHIARRVGGEEQRTIGDVLLLSSSVERHPGPRNLMQIDPSQEFSPNAALFRRCE